MFLLYFLPFFLSFIISAFLTWLLIGISKKLNFSFKKDSLRAWDKKISRLGGIAIIFSFAIAIIINPDLVFSLQLIGFLFGAALILAFGIFDDFFSLSPPKQFLFQVLLSLIIIFSGVKIDYLANPLGGAIRLDGLMVSIGSASFSVWGSAFIIFWIVFLINSLNWADGLDGLLAGVGAIGAISLFFLSVSSLVNQPPLGIISIVFLGAILGFAIFNFYPAKIFMGTSGAVFVGFSLAVISIYSGAKLATLILVLSVPILDALWVIIKRFRSGKSIFLGDYSHLHYRLLDLGFSARQIVLFYYFISAFFAFLAFQINSFGKIIVFSVFAAVMAIILAGVSVISDKKIGRNEKDKELFEPK